MLVWYYIILITILSFICLVLLRVFRYLSSFLLKSLFKKILNIIPVLKLYIFSLKNFFSKFPTFSKSLKFFSFIWSFRNAWLFSLNVSMLILATTTGASAGLIPVIVATTVAGLNALTLKHLFFPNEKEDDLDIALKATKNLDKVKTNQIVAEIPIQETVVSLKPSVNIDITISPRKGILVSPDNFLDYFNETISISQKNLTENSDSSEYSEEYLSQLGGFSSNPTDPAIPYDRWPDGAPIMYNDLDEFIEIYGALPRKTVDDAELSSDEAVEFNNIFASLTKRFFRDVRPFENEEFAREVSFFKEQIIKEGVTKEQYQNLLCKLCIKLNNDYYAPYIQTNLHRLYDDALDTDVLDTWDFNIYLKFLKWLDHAEGITNSFELLMFSTQMLAIYNSAYAKWIAGGNNVDAQIKDIDLAEALDHVD